MNISPQVAAKAESAMHFSVRLLRRLFVGVEWCAFSYLGYWLALLLDAVLPRAVILPLLGATLDDWRLTAFRVILRNGTADHLAPPQWLDAALSLLFLALFLLAVTIAGSRIRNAGFRLWLQFAGLWAVLLLAFQIAIGVSLNRGDLARLTGAVHATWPVTRTALFSLATIAVLLAGTRLVRSIGDCFAAVWADLPAPGLFGRVFLVLPPALFLLGQTGFRLSALGFRWLLLIVAPSAFCLLLTFIEVLTRRWQTRKVVLVQPQRQLRSNFAWTAVVSAVLLGTLLAEAHEIERWLLDRGWSVHTTEHYEIRFHENEVDAQTVLRFAQEREAVYAMETARLGTAPDSMPPPPIRVYLYPDFISKRLATGTDRPFTVDGYKIRALHTERFRTLDPAADAAAILNFYWGPPSSPEIGRWAARWLAGTWYGKNIPEWGAQLTYELGSVSLDELLRADTRGTLPVIDREPLGAFWLQRLAEGNAGVIRRLYSEPSRELTLASVSAVTAVPEDELETHWRQAAAEALQRHPPAASPRRELRANFLRGVSFSHEGWGGRRGGYTGPQAEAELRRLRDLGVNAIALVPYGFQRDPDHLEISMAGTDETDEELMQTLSYAHGLGMAVMLKPQLWIGGGAFTGSISWEDPARRAEWMRHYRAWILHYAQLAELEGFDLLCVGNELGGLTGHTTEWRGLIADVRRVYHGPITYAANWGEEFETLPFWDLVDYIGLNNYYPLRKPGRAESQIDLTNGARQLAQRIESVQRRWNRSVLFTEIGYPSLDGGTAEPWVEDGQRGINLQEQAEGYKAIFAAFLGRPWLKGMFWWKWPSNGRDGGPEDLSFVPRGKPAEEVLGIHYRRLQDLEGP